MDKGKAAARERGTAQESLTLQLTWPQGDDVTDLDVEVDVLSYGTRGSWDMPPEGPTVKVTKVTAVVLVDDEEVTHTWDLMALPKGFSELVHDIVAQMELMPREDTEEDPPDDFDASEVLYSSMEYAERHRDSDYWL